MPQALKRDWPRIKTDYEAGVKTVAAICEEYDITRPVLYTRVGREGWILRQSIRSTARPAMIERLAKILERQIGYLEKNLKPGDEKQAGLLGSLARTLEKLMDLDRKQATEATPGKDPRRAREIAELKRKLAARIDQLRKD